MIRVNPATPRCARGEDWNIWKTFYGIILASETGWGRASSVISPVAGQITTEAESGSKSQPNDVLLPLNEGRDFKNMFWNKLFCEISNLFLKLLMAFTEMNSAGKCGADGVVDPDSFKSMWFWLSGYMDDMVGNGDLMPTVCRLVDGGCLYICFAFVSFLVLISCFLYPPDYFQTTLIDWVFYQILFLLDLLPLYYVPYCLMYILPKSILTVSLNVTWIKSVMFLDCL